MLWQQFQQKVFSFSLGQLNECGVQHCCHYYYFIYVMEASAPIFAEVRFTSIPHNIIQATGCKTKDNGERGMNPDALTIINLSKEYWPSRVSEVLQAINCANTDSDIQGPYLPTILHNVLKFSSPNFL